MYYANSVFSFLFLFKGSSKCGFFHLAVLFRFYRVLFLHHVFLSEQIKMMMMNSEAQLSQRDVSGGCVNIDVGTMNAFSCKVEFSCKIAAR